MYDILYFLPLMPYQYTNIFFVITRSFFEAVALCTFVLHVCASFWSSFLFLKPNFFLLLHDGEFDLIRRAHLLCVLKRNHTYGVNTFVCSYSLNSNSSHFLVLSSLLDWQPYLLCGFPGFVTLLIRANVSNLEQYFTKP